METRELASMGLKSTAMTGSVEVYKEPVDFWKSDQICTGLVSYVHNSHQSVVNTAVPFLVFSQIELEGHIPSDPYNC